MPRNGKKTAFLGPSPDVGKATQFKPGNPGGGRPKTKPITSMFLELLEDGESRAAIKKSMFKALTSGRMAAVLLIREMAERIEGKVPQNIIADITTNPVYSLSDAELDQEIRAKLAEMGVDELRRFLAEIESGQPGTVN